MDATTLDALEQTLQSLRQQNEQLIAQLQQREDYICSLEQQNRFFDLSLDLLCIAGFDGYFKQANRSWTRLLGYTQEELLIQPFIDLVHPDDRAATLAAAATIAAGEPGTYFENRYRCKDGSYKWLSWRSAPVVEENAIYAIARDVTDRKQTEVALRDSEQRFRDVSAAAGEYIWEIDANGIYTFVTNQAKHVKGYSPSELLGRSPFEFMPAEEVPRIQAILQAASNRKESFKLEHRDVLPSGEMAWEEVTGVPILDEQGELVGWRGVGLTITDRKRAEAILQEQEQFLRNVYDGVEHLIFAIDVSDGEFRYAGWNFALERSTGLSAASSTGKTPEEVFGVKRGTAYRENYTRCVTAGTVITYEEKIRLQANDQWFLTTLNPLKDENGVVYRLIGTAAEITDRKQAEAALRQSQEQLDAIINNMPAAIYLKDLQGRYLVMNRKCVSLFNKKLEQMLGKTDYELFPQTIADGLRATDSDVLAAKTFIEREEVAWTVDGLRTFVAIKFPLLNDDGTPYALCGISTDITDRKQAEAALQEQEQFLRSIYDGTQNATFVLDVDEHNTLCYRGWNQAAELVTGISSIAASGKTPQEVFGPDVGEALHQRYTKCLLAKATISYEDCIPLHGEETYWLVTLTPLRDATDRVYRIIGTSIEITDRKQAEEALRRSETELRQKANDLEHTLSELRQTQAQLVQTEKMSSLGQLVAGVAHEINNPVNFIHGNLIHAGEYVQDLMRLIALYHEHYPTPCPKIEAETTAIDLEFLLDDLPKLLSSMRVGTDRIRQIVLALRNFSRMDEAEIKCVDIHDGIDSTLMILQNRLKKTAEHAEIKVIKEYGTLPPIECYAGQLNQVFMNILSNAIDSLDDYNARRSAAVIQQQPSQITIRTELANERVCIYMSDNGAGMSEQTRQRLFEPFFTTKPIGKGTGLGLSISYQVVVDRHGGKLSCISTPGKGATFVLELPLKQSAAALVCPSAR